jgi:hypothetical protein
MPCDSYITGYYIIKGIGLLLERSRSALSAVHLSPFGAGIVCTPAQAEDNPPIRSKKITLPKKAD